MESILSQSFTDFEFLIINDGSTEPCDEIVESFEDNRVVVITQENMGLTRSLNRGIHLARGEHIARMDADDISAQGRLQAQVSVLHDDDRIDLVGSFFDVIDGNRTLVESKKPFVDSVYRLWRLQFHNNYGARLRDDAQKGRPEGRNVRRDPTIRAGFRSLVPHVPKRQYLHDPRGFVPIQDGRSE